MQLKQRTAAWSAMVMVMVMVMVMMMMMEMYDVQCSGEQLGLRDDDEQRGRQPLGPVQHQLVLQRVHAQTVTISHSSSRSPPRT